MVLRLGYDLGLWGVKENPSNTEYDFITDDTQTQRNGDGNLIQNIGLNLPLAIIGGAIIWQFFLK